MNVIYNGKPCNAPPMYMMPPYHTQSQAGQRPGHNNQPLNATYYVPVPHGTMALQSYPHPGYQGSMPTYVIVPDQMMYAMPCNGNRKFSSSSTHSRRSSGSTESRKTSVSSQGYHSSASQFDSSSGSDVETLKKTHRSHSGDSGIASSSTFGSDDDSDVAKSIDVNSGADANEEEVWTAEQDKLFWRSQNRFPPSHGMCLNIVKQLEFYFCDEYLSKDKYLLRQVRCKKAGYVSIKLLASFKKMKKFAPDWETVRSAVFRKSSKLVVSEDGFRLRRITALSEELMKPRLLTSVLAIRLPEEYNSVDKVTSLFRVFGEIGLVRLLRPGKAIPTDLRNYATQVPDIGTSLCAVVEFDASSAAMSAVRVIKSRYSDMSEFDENYEENYEVYLQKMKDLPSFDDMRLALLGPRLRRTLYRQDREKEQGETLEKENKTQQPKENRPSLSPSKRNPETPRNVIRMPCGPSNHTFWIRSSK